MQFMLSTNNPISAIPGTAAQSLFSRRRQAEEIRGDVILFPLETSTTNPQFVATVKQAQQEMYKLIEKDFGLINKIWIDKASRHSQKFYKRHKKLHMSFAAIVPPCPIPIYTVKKTQQTPDQLERADQVLKAFINQPLSGKVKECKLNPDGHMVIRVAIQPAELLLACKAEISTIFGGSYNRYDDPEKQTTLAIVLGVVDYTKFNSAETKAKLEQRLDCLAQELMKLDSIPLLDIEWIEYSKRTISPNSQLSMRSYHHLSPL
jgi:hypothetical protein